MALLSCHECGNDVSSEAKACPKCGAKVKKEMSHSTKIFLIAALACGIGLLAYILYDHTPNARYTPPPLTQPAQTTNAGWDYSTKTDTLSGKDISFATVPSLDTQNLHSPYGPNIKAYITLRKHPRHKLSAFVDIDAGQLLCRSYESCTIMIRFDDRTPIKFSGIGSKDGSTEMVFIRHYERFLSELKKSKTAFVELPLYQDGNRTWSFNVKDLKWQ